MYQYVVDFDDTSHGNVFNICTQAYHIYTKCYMCTMSSAMLTMIINIQLAIGSYVSIIKKLSILNLYFIDPDENVINLLSIIHKVYN